MFRNRAPDGYDRIIAGYVIPYLSELQGEGQNLDGTLWYVRVEHNPNLEGPSVEIDGPLRFSQRWFRDLKYPEGTITELLNIFNECSGKNADRTIGPGKKESGGIAVSCDQIFEGTQQRFVTNVRLDIVKK